MFLNFIFVLHVDIKENLRCCGRAKAVFRFECRKLIILFRFEFVPVADTFALALCFT